MRLTVTVHIVGQAAVSMLVLSLHSCWAASCCLLCESLWTNTRVHLCSHACINVCMLAHVFLCMYACVHVCMSRSEVTVLPQDNRRPKEPLAPMLILYSQCLQSNSFRLLSNGQMLKGVSRAIRRNQLKWSSKWILFRLCVWFIIFKNLYWLPKVHAWKIPRQGWVLIKSFICFSCS